MLDKVRERTDYTSVDDTDVFVSTRVSMIIATILLIGAFAAWEYHWGYFLFSLSSGFILAGLSSMVNWRKQLLEEGEAPRDVLDNIKHATLIPTILIMIAGIVIGWNAFVSGGLSILLGMSYFVAIYALGFWKIEPDNLYFERHPFTSDEYVFLESRYIELIEDKATEKAKENGYI